MSAPLPSVLFAAVACSGGSGPFPQTDLLGPFVHVPPVRAPAVTDGQSGETTTETPPTPPTDTGAADTGTTDCGAASLTEIAPRSDPGTGYTAHDVLAALHSDAPDAPSLPLTWSDNTHSALSYVLTATGSARWQSHPDPACDAIAATVTIAFDSDDGSLVGTGRGLAWGPPAHARWEVVLDPGATDLALPKGTLALIARTFGDDASPQGVLDALTEDRAGQTIATWSFGAR